MIQLEGWGEKLSSALRPKYMAELRGAACGAMQRLLFASLCEGTALDSASTDGRRRTHSSWREGDVSVPHRHVRTFDPGASSLAPAQPAQVLCTPVESMPADHAHAAGSSSAAPEPPASGAGRTPNPPGRSVDEVMRAFREQRRLAKEEGSPSVVIRHILAKAGPGSLLSDLAQQK